MTAPDFIAIAIADEEHRQGRPYLADPEHCARCAEIDVLWAQAVCEHEHAETATLATMDSATWDEITQCGDCGLVTRHVQYSEWVMWP